MPDSSLELPGFMVAFIVVFVVVFVAGVAFAVVSWRRNWRAARQAGLDPLAAQTQVAGRLYNSGALVEARTPKERLAELEDLRAKGLVGQDEYQQIRSRILGEI